MRRLLRRWPSLHSLALRQAPCSSHQHASMALQALQAHEQQQQALSASPCRAHFVLHPPAADQKQSLATSACSSASASTTFDESTALTFETHEVAHLADGACVLRHGGTTVLATAVGSKEMAEGEDPSTLQVSFREPMYSTGLIPHSVQRRERGAGTERETLMSRAIDRSLRPLLLPGYHYPIDVQVRVLSQDPGSVDPDVMSINAASTACMLSNVPWGGPVGAVRVARINGQLVVNPGYSVLEEAEMDLLVAGSKTGVLMIEMGGRQVPEQCVAEALQLAQAQIGPLIQLQLDFAKKHGREKWHAPLFEVPAAMQEQATVILRPLLQPMLRQGGSMSKAQRGTTQEVAKAQGWEQMQLWWASQQHHHHHHHQQQQQQQPNQQQEQARTPGQQPVAAQSQESTQPAPLSYAQYTAAFNAVLSAEMRALVLAEGLRPDGRLAAQLRPLSVRASYLPPGVVHGSALFSRGETQSLCVATVGNNQDCAVIDGPRGPVEQSFMLHYSFPPFCTNEIDQIKEPSRREIGHGALARRALQYVMPRPEDSGWPFTTRVNTETLASNGSSSMAAVCGGCLALQCAGVPIHSPVAGVSIGMASQGHPSEWDLENDKKQFALLTDIAGIEDSLGDMDFKIAGTEHGITAMQMDMKLPGIPVEVLNAALYQAQGARAQILQTMAQAMATKQQQQTEDDSPCTETLHLDKDCALLLLGERGRVLATLEHTSGAKLVVGDEGDVQIYAPIRSKMSAACAAVRAVEGTDLIQGQEYPAKVLQLFDWGAVILLPSGAKHVLHISEVAHGQVQDVSQELQVGEDIRVQCLGRDLRGMTRLSRKACLPQPEAEQKQQST